ncbi:MAG: VCBS repeat-containing protein, partial [Patescibacteria group bacterium]
MPRIALAPSDGAGELKTFDNAGHAFSDAPVRMPYAPFRVPYTMASAKNGLVVFGAGPGGGPHIRIFTSDGKLYNQFFAYDRRWRIGVNIAVGDVDGDGEEEIITAPASRGGAHIKIFSFDGHLKQHFFAYPQQVRSGYELAVGDLNNDGKDEFVIARTTGVPGGEVSVFSDSGLLIRFTPYPESGVEHVAIAVGDV